MKLPISPFKLRIYFQLGVLLTMVYGIVALTTLLWAGPFVEQGAPWPAAAALLAAVGLGLILSLPLVRTLRQVTRALEQASAGQVSAQLSTRWRWPLADLVTSVNAATARVQEASAGREAWLVQAHEAAALQERNRLARDLHDSIKQQLFALSLSASAALARWEHDPAQVRAALNDVQRSAQEAMSEMNALLQQLSPAPLEKAGLVQALRDQCEALGYRTGAEIAVAFGALPADDRLPPGAQESVFRVAQEALSNIARHARASHVRLYLGQAAPGGPLELEIIDDGKGFEVPQGNGGGMGLANIHQRTRELGGTLELVSAPGEGTTLRVQIPLALPFETQEDNMYKPDHTFNKTFLAGLLGGLALIATLYYPLYVLVPGLYVHAWPAGQPWLGWILQVVALVLIIGTGYAAAHWTKAGTRASNTLLGALAGGLAGLVAYFGLGAMASSVAAWGWLAQYELSHAAATTEDLVMTLVIESASTYILFWLVLLISAGLGALGGVLAPQGAAPAESEWRYSGQALLTAAAVGGAAALWLSVLHLWEAGGGYFNHMLWTDAVRGPIFSFLAILTPIALYLAPLAGLHRLVRAEGQNLDPQRLARLPGQAYGYATLAFSAAGLILVGLFWSLSQASRQSDVMLNAVLGMAGPLIVAAILSALLGRRFIAAGRVFEQDQRATGQPPLPHDVQSLVAGAGGAILAAVCAQFVLSYWLGRQSSLSAILPAGVTPLAATCAQIVVGLVLWYRWRSLPLAISAKQWALRLQENTSTNLGVLVLSLFPVLAFAAGVTNLFPTGAATFSLWTSSTQDSLQSPYLRIMVERLYLMQGWALFIGLAMILVGVGMAAIVNIGYDVLRRRNEAKSEVG